MITNNISDSEILMLIKANNEEAKEYMLTKYKNIIDILMAKYNKVFYKVNIDKQDAYAEALFAFNEALTNFNELKDSSFPSFLSLCIKRRFIKLVRKHNTEKSKFNNELYSLDYVYSAIGIPLIDTIKDEESDPLNLITEEETKNNLLSSIAEVLSLFEYEVFEYMIDGLSYVDIAILMDKNSKQIDNAIQRIKLKIKDLL